MITHREVGSISSNGQFETHRLLVKHDNQYRAPDEGDNLKMEELMKSMQFERSQKEQEG